MQFEISLGTGRLLLRYAFFATLFVLSIAMSLESESWSPVLFVIIGVSLDVNYLVTRVGITKKEIVFHYLFKIRKWPRERLVRIIKSGWSYEVSLFFRDGSKVHSIPVLTYPQSEIDSLVVELNKGILGSE